MNEELERIACALEKIAEKMPSLAEVSALIVFMAQWERHALPSEASKRCWRIGRDFAGRYRQEVAAEPEGGL